MKDTFANCLNKSRDANGKLNSVLEEFRTTSPEDIDVQSDEQFLDAIIEMLFFGSETISSAGFSIIYNLTKESHVLENLKEDIKEKGFFESSEDVDSPCDLQQMNYADAVVKETLRVLPPVGGAYRTVIKSFELEVGVLQDVR